MGRCSSCLTHRTCQPGQSARSPFPRPIFPVTPSSSTTNRPQIHRIERPHYGKCRAAMVQSCARNLPTLPCSRARMPRPVSEIGHDDGRDIALASGIPRCHIKNVHDRELSDQVFGRGSANTTNVVVQGGAWGRHRISGRISGPRLSRLLASVHGTCATASSDNVTGFNAS